MRDLTWTEIIKGAFREPMFGPGGYLLLSVALLVWRGLTDPPVSKLVEALAAVAFMGVYVCLQYLDGIRHELARGMEGIRREETRQARVSDWALTYYKEIQKDLPETAREELEEIARTKIYRWVERHQQEIKQLPVEARQSIYEIAETRR
jgi:hypothetical protein